MPLQIRRGTNAERGAMTQPLAAGELLYTTDTKRIYVGDNSTLGGIAVTGYTDEDAQDAVAPLFVNGNHTGITFTYGLTQDGANRIDATVDLSAFQGPVIADSVKGSVFADDSTILVDGVSGRIVGPVYSNVTGNVTGDLTGNVSGNVTGDVTGNLTGNSTGYHTGDVKGSIFADDSAILVDAVSGRIVGPVYSDVVGTFSGSLASNLDLAGYGISGSGTISLTSDTDSIRAITGFRGVNSDAPFAVHVRRSRGTTASPTVLTTSDQISALVSEGYDGSSYTQSSAIITRAVGTVTAGAVPGQLEFYTTNFLGTSIQRLVMDHAGLITATANLRIDSTTYSASSSPLAVRQFHDTADANNVTFSRARGTTTAPTAVQNGDDLCDVGFSAYDGTAYVGVGGISSTVTGSVSTGSVPTKLTLSVHSGSSVVERLSIASDGVITYTSPVLTAGQVNTGAGVATYWKVNINGTEYAIPAYALV